MSKIGSQHLERRACVYVRQSTMAQVHQHQESTQRQYNLRQRAAVLGWQNVEVIDDDQGRSGKSADGRDGFQRLVSDVAMGRVGAIFGLDVSRLARSCVDWYRLLEVAALSGTLIVDEDGVYDPRHYNDRLLLGLLDASRAAQVLHNPLYAGMYAYDRRNARNEDPEDPAAGGRILIPGSHPGYITGEQLEKNQARLAANRTMCGWERQKGTPREGKSLLQGIVLCGRCGRHMYVRYRGEDVIYACRDGRTRRPCQLIVGRHVEPLIEKALLDAVSRQELELAVKAMERLAGRARELDQQWQKRIEAACYEAEKAARRYHQTEPENRLVTRTLEKEWNARLEEVEGIEQEYERVRRPPPFELTENHRQKILALSEDLPGLWRAPTTTHTQRKQVTRLLLEDVTLRSVDCPWAVDVAIRWKTGVVTRYRAERIDPRPRTTRADAVARIQELVGEKTDREIAEILNREGHRTGRERSFTAGSVVHIRRRRQMTHLRRSSEALVARIAELSHKTTDAQIAESLNADGQRNGFERPFTASAILHIRFKHGLKKRSEARQASDPSKKE